MGMEETRVITRMLENHQEENRQQLSELRESTSEMAKAVSSLTTTIARVEERHASQDDGLKRVGKQVDDHETRIREIENNKQAIKGGWKVVAAIVITAVTVITAVGAAILPIVLGG